MELNVTFFIQLGAFLATVFILSGTVFGPLLNTFDERHKRIEGAREEAARLAGNAGSQAGTIEKRLSEARNAGQEEMAGLKAEGEKREAELVGKAREEATRKLEEAKKSIQSAAEAARKDLGTQANTLAEAIANKALGRNA